MKLKSKLSFITLAVSSVFIICCSSGCKDNSSKSVSCHKCEEHETRIASLERQYKELKCVIDEKDKAIGEKNKIIDAKDRTIGEKDKVIDGQNKEEREARKRYIILSIIAYVALGINILLTGGYILMMRSSKKNTQKTVVDNLHCPRCGWEHAAGETICKNCKTHF